MKKIKSASVAGKFYPENKSVLESLMREFEENNRKQYNYSTNAIIVPHAGYIYSGQLASEGFQYLNKNAQNVFIFAPAHYKPVDGIAVSSFDAWQTPLGDVDVNQKVTQVLIDHFDAHINDDAIDPEHSLEVQVPFIQHYLPDAKIVPILVGDAELSIISEILYFFGKNEKNAFVISSDLSHFYHDSEAKKIDNVTADMIETQETADFNSRQACGSIGILGLVEFAKLQEFSLVRVNLQNSSVTSGDKNRVVGYGTWLLYQGTKEKFVKENFSELLLDICKKSIKEGFITGRNLQVKPADFSEVLQQSGASFVTLEIDGELRGCIGSIIANKSLIEDIAQNAYSSAFSDSRFPPLTQEEFQNLDIAISLLSAPSQMTFDGEEDLLSQIEQDVDGLIIKDGYYRAVYLPSVWEQLPDKRLFLNSLKQKAGLWPDYFSNTFEAFRFRTEYIKK